MQFQSPLPAADGGTRTRTALSGPRILSPLRLPFRHIGVCREVARNQAAWRDCASAKSATSMRLAGGSRGTTPSATVGLLLKPCCPTS